MSLNKKLIHQLKIDDKRQKQLPTTWEELYGIGKGLWKTDAQDYINRLREDRF